MKQRGITVVAIIIKALLIGTLLTSCSTKEETVGKVHPEWALDATIYELNVRQFTPEGTFQAAAEHLDRLAELGVDIIWVMPIQRIGALERKGSLGSYYAIADYLEVNPEFGTMDDFRALVDEAHKRGLRIILDWVANHTSPDAVWTVEHPEWYEQNAVGGFVAPYDWSDVAKLDYTNKEMRRAMVDAMLYWLREARIDGFRCDVASEVPTDFWNDAIVELIAAKEDIFMLAEAESPELQEHAFDMYYGWELHHIMNKIAAAEQNVDSLRTYFRNHERRFKSGFSMNFTSNHDENSWNGTAFERMGDGVKTFAALTYVLPGMPLIYNGQEIGLNRRLEFFDKDSINWEKANEYTEFYKSLNRLRKETPALHSTKGEMELITSNAPSQILSFVRKEGDSKMVALFNLSNEELSVTFDWRVEEGEYVRFDTGEQIAVENSKSIEFGAWEYMILVKKQP